MPSPTEITTTQLARLVGTPTCPAVIDVRIDEDYAADPVLIPGARRRDFGAVASWAAEYAVRDYRGAHGRKLQVDDVAELGLSVVRDADGGEIVVHAYPFMRGAVLEILRYHYFTLSICLVVVEKAFAAL